MALNPYKRIRGLCRVDVRDSYNRARLGPHTHAHTHIHTHTRTDTHPHRTQTYVGSILVALNPYKGIRGLYGEDMRERYSRARLGELPPHIYALSREAYHRLCGNQQNQVCVCGRHGVTLSMRSDEKK